MRRHFTRPNVVVVGSLNLDYIAGVERLPRPGETIAARTFIRRFGGKGANQAIAAARQGVGVAMIGCVGADKYGEAYRGRLRDEGIDTAGISSSSKALTGAALIAVDRRAENIIIVAAGANSELKPGAIRAARRLITSASIILLQWEIPMATVIEAVLLANRADVPVVLNPSPLRNRFPWADCRLDTLVTNSGEATAIFKQPLADLRSRLPAWRRALGKRNIKHLIITRGAASTICINRDDCFEVPALHVQPVDTVGAGDAFTGAFVACRAQGADLLASARYANCAGALATLKPGAQESIPIRKAIEIVLRESA